MFNLLSPIKEESGAGCRVKELMRKQKRNIFFLSASMRSSDPLPFRKKKNNRFHAKDIKIKSVAPQFSQNIMQIYGRRC